MPPEDDVRPPAEDNRSLSDVLGEAFDKHATTTDTSTTAPAAPAAPASTATPPASTPAAASTDSSGQPARDAFGRFAPKEGTDGTANDGKPAAQRPAGATDGSAASAAPGAAAPGAVAGQPAAGQPAAVAPDNEVPASWKAEMKPLWDKVPAEVRPYLHQRDRELTQGFQQVAERANVAQAVLQEFAPYAEQLQRENATPVMAMRTLLQTAHALRTGGPEYRKSIILSLAQQYGVDLAQPYNAALATAEAQAATLATEKLYGQAQAMTQQQTQIVNAFNAFASDPANEFFPQVRQIMGNLITAGVANDLPTAYSMALGMEPTVRQTLMQREAAKAGSEDARRRTAAGMSVTGAPGGARMHSEPASTGSARADLRATLERNFG